MGGGSSIGQCDLYGFSDAWRYFEPPRYENDKTKEPLMIEGPNGDENYYVLPLGTTLYHDKSFPEGHDRYVVYLNHKGAIAHEDVPMKPEYGGSFIDPLWLANVDADNLKDIFKRFPLSKKDIAAAIKANEITKDDLADIIRSMPD
ncbi:hypothetical protein [Pseudomonas sp. N40(2020)]|uniref:hypothetical protein n=1 Tax=Pseudomonas sp. N40(2020) TaxID=2767798 RepID=UPI00292A5B7D|nr:hypothetical protein [Pseudomonas sp. N40(2020)]